jgi:hypothetical protein
MTIGKREIIWLMDGLDIYQQDAHKTLKYSTLF